MTTAVESASLCTHAAFPIPRYENGRDFYTNDDEHHVVDRAHSRVTVSSHVYETLEGGWRGSISHSFDWDWSEHYGCYTRGVGTGVWGCRRDHETELEATRCALAAYDRLVTSAH